MLEHVRVAALAAARAIVRTSMAHEAQRKRVHPWISIDSAMKFSLPSSKAVASLSFLRSIDPSLLPDASFTVEVARHRSDRADKKTAVKLRSNVHVHPNDRVEAAGLAKCE